MDTNVTDPPPPELDAPPPAPTGWWSSLRRSSTDRLLGGVAGGLALRLGVPTLLVRAALVLASVFGFVVPLYVLAWVLLPDERGERVAGHGAGRDLLVLGAVVISGFVLLAQIDDLAFGSLIGRSLPWLVVLGGLALLLRRNERPSASAGPSAATAVAPTAAGVMGPPRPLPSPPVPRPPRPRPVVGPLTWCAALIALAVLGLIELADGRDSTTLGPGAMVAVVLIVFGAGLTFSAFRGRARGLILPALALITGLAGLTALDVRADTTAGPFDLTVTDASELPGEVESLIGDNQLDVSALRLDADRTVRIRQTSGALRIVLPLRTSARVVVDVATGWAEVQRPSARWALGDTEFMSRWVEEGLPSPGQTLTAADLRRQLDGSGTLETRSIDRSGVVVDTDMDSEATLTIDVDLGVGELTIIDPRWTDVPDSIVVPEQLCTVGGGARGVVRTCSEVPEANRVALCINESGFLVDCREDRPGTVDFPRVAACRGADGSEMPCDLLGIEPVGAELISPDPDAAVEDTIAPADPIDPVDAADPTVDEATNSDPSLIDPGDPALVPGTIALPTPEATVPPVPTPGG